MKKILLVFLLVAFSGIVSADDVVPTKTTYYFTENGVPVEEPLNFTIKCYGYSWPPGPPFVKEPGTYTPREVFTLSDACEYYGCVSEKPYYLNYRHIDYCDLIVTTFNNERRVFEKYAETPVPEDCVEEPSGVASTETLCNL